MTGHDAPGPAAGCRRGGWGRLVRPAYYLIGLPGCVALACIVFGTIGLHHSLPDDAFILLVYVRHLVEHGSIYWNVEEGHVDGCTSILDLLVKSLLYAVTRSTDLLRMNWFTTIVLVVVVAVAAVAILGALARRRRDLLAYGVAITTAVAVAGHRAAIEGAVFLLETPLYLVTVLASVATLLFVRRWTQSWLVVFGIECALMMLARPEAVLLATLFLGYVVLSDRQEGKESSLLAPRRRMFVAPAVAFAILGIYIGWHVHYFGYWAPNTYYAKKSASRLLEIEDGIQYVIAFTGFKWGKVAIASTVLAPLLVLARAWTAPEYRRVFLLLSGAGLLNLLSIVVAGGDCYFGLGRFLGCASILSLLALAIAAMHLGGAWRAFAFLPILLLAYGNVVVGVRGLTAKIERLKEAWPLETRTLECDIQATAAIESLGVSSFAQTDLQRFKFLDDRLRVIDASGLNDKQAAHEKVDARVRWGKGGVAHAVRTKAEAFSYGYRFPYSPQPMAEYSSRELVHDDAIRDRFIGSRFGEAYPEPNAAQLLHDHFRPASMRACGGWFNFWLRADIVDRFEGRDDVIIGRRDPAIVIPLDSGRDGVRFEGFDRVESTAEGTARRAVGEGIVRIAADAAPLGSTGPCAIGLLSGPGSATFVPALDGQLLRPTAQLHRYALPTAPRWNGTKEHELHLGTRAGDPNTNIVLTGIFLEECDRGR